MTGYYVTCRGRQICIYASYVPDPPHKTLKSAKHEACQFVDWYGSTKQQRVWCKDAIRHATKGDIVDGGFSYDC